MNLDVAGADVQAVYQALTGVVTPRPIAWVTTLSPAGIVNLAPFSFFNAFGANPAIVVFSPTLKRDGTKKDTLVNLEALGEFVVNASTVDLAERINLTAKEVAPDVSEVELAGLHTAPSEKVRVPRVAEAAAALECVVKQILSFGTGPIAPNLVIAEVVSIYVRDDVLGDDGRPDPAKLQTVGRLGGEHWCRTTDLFALKRP